jgi:hypothetical protein
MFIDPMKSSGKIRKGKITGRFYIRAFKLYGEKVLAKGKDYIARSFLKTWLRSIARRLQRNFSKRVKRSDQCAGVRCSGNFIPQWSKSICQFSGRDRRIKGTLMKLPEPEIFLCLS